MLNSGVVSGLAGAVRIVLVAVNDSACAHLGHGAHAPRVRRLVGVDRRASVDVVPVVMLIIVAVVNVHALVGRVVDVGVALGRRARGVVTLGRSNAGRVQSIALVIMRINLKFAIGVAVGEDRVHRERQGGEGEECELHIELCIVQGKGSEWTGIVSQNETSVWVSVEEC
jgi:hypothetical protein